jgi:hypothetical protein
MMGSMDYNLSIHPKRSQLGMAWHCKPYLSLVGSAACPHHGTFGIVCRIGLDVEEYRQDGMFFY